jgi:putative SOS response-associated peptidase YedK
MCYYNGIKVPRDEYIRLMNLEKEIKALAKLFARPLVSGFEYSDCPIIKSVNAGQDIDVVAAHWEFIPYWLKTMGDVVESRKKFTTLNAVGEKLLESRMYKDAALKRRCLVISSGFYEWRHYKPEGAKKDIAYPYHVTVRGKEYFFMAGIWQPWTDQETGETIDTFAIVTAEANNLMAQIHNKKKRMPTILPDSLALEWIQDGLSESRIAELATFQYPTEEMEGYTVNKDFRGLEEPQTPFLYAELPSIV